MPLLHFNDWCSRTSAKKSGGIVHRADPSGASALAKPFSVPTPRRIGRARLYQLPGPSDDP